MKGTLWVVATEPSGDKLGHAILTQLKELAPELQFTGIGGPLMEAAGEFRSRVDWTSLAHMGLVSVLKDLPFLHRTLKETMAAVQREKPMGLLTIDGPDFCLRVSQKILSIPRIHCVAPSVWAWRPWRARSLAKKTDHLLCLFPFESSYFSHMPHSFVGHPILMQPKAEVRHNQDPLLALLPGSRQSEVKACLRAFLKTFFKLKEKIPLLQAVVLTTDTLAPWMRSQVPETIPIIMDPQEKQWALAGTTLALAACGSVSLDLAHQGVPMILGYRLSALEGWLARRLIRLPYVSLINIVAQDLVVPELLQKDFTAENLTTQALAFFHDPNLGAAQVQACQKALQSLWALEDFGQKSARIILEVIRWESSAIHSPVSNEETPRPSSQP